MKKQRVTVVDSISQMYIMLNIVIENIKFVVHIVLFFNTI